MGRINSDFIYNDTCISSQVLTGTVCLKPQATSLVCEGFHLRRLLFFQTVEKYQTTYDTIAHSVIAPSKRFLFSGLYQVSSQHK